MNNSGNAESTENVETTAKKVAKPKDSTTRKKSADKESMMYVGPTILGVAIQNTVYTEMPEALEEAQKECPEFGNLYLPIMKYAMAEQMIRKKSGYIYTAYKKALEYKETRSKEGGII